MSEMQSKETIRQKRWYFDYAAATPLDPRVAKIMLETGQHIYGNPSSLHLEGRAAKECVENCRQEVANLLGAKAKEIFFCSGGSEADNLAILGVARANKERGKHIVISSIEHKAIHTAAVSLKKEGFEIDVCSVDRDGRINLHELQELVRDDTILVSVIYANNEIGTIQDLQMVSRAVKDKNPGCYVHTDACQAVNYLDIDVRKLEVDLMSISGNKIYGPKSSGILYVKQGVRLQPIIWGGGQEFGLRAGTEDAVKITGMTEALKIARRIVEVENQRLYELREKIFSFLQSEIDDVAINGSRKDRLVNNINVSVAGAEGESLVLYLDEAGVAASTGSACSAADLNPSSVLLAIGLPIELAHCSLRISLGRYTSEEGVEQLLLVLPEVINKVRSMSAFVNK